MSAHSLERSFQDLQGRVLPVRMKLFTTHSISAEEQQEMIAKLYPTYQRQQDEGSSGMKVSPRMEELKGSVPFTSSRQLAATRITAKYIGLHLIAATYRQAAEADRKRQIPEFCFYTDVGWAQFQIATNIDLAHRAGSPAETLHGLEQRASRGQERMGSMSDLDPAVAKALLTMRLAAAHGQSLFLLDEDPTGKKMIEHYVQAMQQRDTAIGEVNMHPAQGLDYVALGGRVFRDSFEKLYPTALALRPRPELRFS